MSERLRRFLIALATDEERTVRYVEEALGESDLSAEEIAVVRSRDPERVRRVLGAGPGAVIRVLSWWKRKQAKKKRKTKRKTKGARYSASRRTRRTSKKRSRRATPRRQR